MLKLGFLYLLMWSEALVRNPRIHVQFGFHTNCPFEAFPLPKGHYYVKDVLINTSKWPLIAPRGFVKFGVTVRNNGEVMATQILVIEIKDITQPYSTEIISK